MADPGLFPPPDPISGPGGIPPLGGGPGGPFGGPGGGLGGGWGNWGPYLPLTPLGSAGAAKGDLLAPIVAVGIGLAIVLFIFLAVKAVLAWKVGILEAGIAGKKFLREVGDAPASHLDESVINDVHSQVMDALDSQKNCTQAGTPEAPSE